MEKQTEYERAGITVIRSENLEDCFFDSRSFGQSVDVVTEILQNVKEHGDKALHEYCHKFEKANPSSFEISKEDLKSVEAKFKADKPELYESLCYSRDLALRFATRQRESFDDFEIELEKGLFTGQKTIAVERAGAYVPAGRFPLVSSVIMTLTPAKAAGVNEVILCTPPRPAPDGSNKPWADEGIMAAASICGADRVFAIGGAQAIAAMTYGTESIPAVQVVVGPGNKYVAAAKKQVYGTVGIDLIAGPSEVMIIADDNANPEWVAADLLAQAEHDIDAQAVLVTTSEKLVEGVCDWLGKELASLPTENATTARASLEHNGYIILTDTLDEAAEIANRKAPEHLELALDAGSTRDALAAKVRNFGSLFIGHGSAEVFGDYAAGLNHTLPTSGSARFTGGLSVRYFLKTVTTLRAEPASDGTIAKGCEKSAKAAGYFGEAEGLYGHAHAARIRLGQK